MSDEEKREERIKKTDDFGTVPTDRQNGDPVHDRYDGCDRL